MYSSGTGSLAIWARSSDFNTLVNVYDPTGALTGSDDSSGWNESGDIDNAAVNVQLTQVGTYQVQLSSSNGTYGLGRCDVHISPGCDKKLSWVGHDPIYLLDITSSNHLAICDDGAQIVFYNVATNTLDKVYTSASILFPTLDQTYGAAYSKNQDRVFAWIYDRTYSGDAIAEFDNTGSLIASYDISAYNMGYGPLCYDRVNDRIFIMPTNQVSPQAKFLVWDCATRTAVGGAVNYINPTPGSTAWCTYSEINNRYYISYHNLAFNHAMTWVDASNFTNSGSTATAVHDFIEFISGSNVIGCSRNNTGGNDYRGFVLMDPVTDTIVYSSLSGDNLRYFECGANYDECQDVIVVGLDMTAGTANASGLLCMDKLTYSASNFIAVQNTGYGEFLMAMSFVQTGSRLYMATYDYNQTSSLYSCKISCQTASALIWPTLSGSTVLTVTSGSPVACLSWSYSDNDAAGYVVEKGTNLTNYAPYTTVATSSQSASYADTAVAEPLSYWYRVRPYSNVGAPAPYSNTASIYFPFSPIPGGDVPLYYTPTSSAATWSDQNGSHTGDLPTFLSTADTASVTSLTMSYYYGPGFVVVPITHSNIGDQLTTLTAVNINNGYGGGFATLVTSGSSTYRNTRLQTLNIFGGLTSSLTPTLIDVSYNTGLLRFVAQYTTITSLDFTNNSLLRQITASNLWTSAPYTPVCTSLIGVNNKPALISLAVNNNALSSVDVSGSILLTNVNLNTNTLSQSAVDAVLAALNINGASNGSVNLAGTGNAAPTGGGANADLVALQGRGWTVTTN